MKHGGPKLSSFIRFIAKQNEAVTKAPSIGWGPWPAKGPGSLTVQPLLTLFFLENKCAFFYTKSYMFLFVLFVCLFVLFFCFVFFFVGTGN